MAKNKSLNAALKAKQDEFYTQLPDIENEMQHYEDHFRGKVVYCNCDDPRISNFPRYFIQNFARLGIKRLITTCYKDQRDDIFTQSKPEPAVYLEYDGMQDGDGVPSAEQIGIRHLRGDGDFRRQECIEILRRADIVVTNPPFSLFREYVAQLMKYQKEFIIIGNLNAIKYRAIFPLVENGAIRLGVNRGTMEFLCAGNYVGTVSRVDGNGNKYVKLGNARWYTSLSYQQRYEDLELSEKYSPEKYPKYDNYDAINVNKVREIPCDYEEAMGVPISFLDKHNPLQFEIIGLDRALMVGLIGKVADFQINSKTVYSRVVIKNRKVSHE